MNKIKRIYFGSCKINPSKHEYLNLLAHVISFYNNRGWDKHKWFNYDHVFVFISPDLFPSPSDEQSLLCDLVKGKVDPQLNLAPAPAPPEYEIKKTEVKEIPLDSNYDLEKTQRVIVADITTDSIIASTPQQIVTDEEGDTADISPNPTSPPLAHQNKNTEISFMDSDRVADAINEFLEGGQSDRLKSICDIQLSNYNVDGASPFKWNFELTAEYRALIEQPGASQNAENQTEPLPTCQPASIDITSETTVTVAENPTKSAKFSEKQKIPDDISAESGSNKMEDSVSAKWGSKERFKVVKSLALDIGGVIAGKLFEDLSPEQYQKTEKTSFFFSL